MGHYLVKVDDLVFDIDNVSKRFVETDLLFLNDLGDIVFQCPLDSVYFLVDAAEVEDDLYAGIPFVNNIAHLPFKTH